MGYWGWGLVIAGRIIELYNKSIHVENTTAYEAIFTSLIMICPAVLS
jgi:hypothetical protein